MYLSRGTIDFEEFMTQVDLINKLIDEYNKILLDLGMEGKLLMISKECWDLLGKTETQLSKTETQLKNTEKKLENQDKIINFLCKKLNIDPNKIDESNFDN